MKIKSQRLIAVALATLLATNSIYSPARAWIDNAVEATTFGGPNLDSSLAVAQDSNRNIYVGANFRVASDFDPTSGYDTRTANTTTSVNNEDMAFSKFDSNGDRLWTYSYFGPGVDSIQDIAVDASNNVYVAGYFQVTLDLNPTSGIDSFTSTNSVVADCFISKFDSSGNYLWTKTFGGNSTDYLYTLTIDANGNVLAGGTFAETVDFDPSPSATASITATGNQDAFVVKLNSNGEYVWAAKFGGAAGDYSYSLSTGTTGDVFVTGYFNSTADMNPGTGVNNVVSKGNADTFLVKLNSSGVYQWSTSLGSTGNEWFKSAVVADASGNSYLALRASGSINYQSIAASETFTVSGTTDIEVFKFNGSGVLQWGRQLVGSGADQVDDMEIDSNSNLYIAGAVGSGGLIYLNPADSSTTITSNGGSDGIIWKLNSSGSYLGYDRFGGTSSDYVYDIDVTNLNKMVISGTFSSTMTLNTGSISKSFTSAGNSDCFVIRLATIASTTSNLPPVISLTSYSTPVSKGIQTSLVATSDTVGRVQFLANGKRIANCVSIRTSGTAPSLTATCNWKPTLQGSVVLRAKLIVDSATAVISEPKLIYVQRRTNSR